VGRQRPATCHLPAPATSAQNGGSSLTWPPPFEFLEASLSREARSTLAVANFRLGPTSSASISVTERFSPSAVSQERRCRSGQRPCRAPGRSWPTLTVIGARGPRASVSPPAGWHGRVGRRPPPPGRSRTERDGAGPVGRPATERAGLLGGRHGYPTSSDRRRSRPTPTVVAWRPTPQPARPSRSGGSTSRSPARRRRRGRPPRGRSAFGRGSRRGGGPGAVRSTRISYSPG
jgi:hypothetical protein